MTAAFPPNAFVPAAYRVIHRRREISDVATLELAPEAGEVPAFTPGQFNMLYAFGVGEVAISVSGDPEDRDRFVHTVRAVGAVSAALARLEAGQMLGLRGPFGTGWPMVPGVGSDLVIVAGGLGLAPLRPALYHLLSHRADYGGITVLYGTRHPREILYRREIERWRRRLDLDIEITVDHADRAWHGHVGVVPALIPRAAIDPENTFALVCGPEAMMRFTVAGLRDAGLPPERIYLSMERNMKCALGLCGRCQFGPTFVCKDGPVMRFDRISKIFATREI